MKKHSIFQAAICLLLTMLASCSGYTHTVRQVPNATVEKSLLRSGDSTIQIAAGQKYKTNWLHTFFYGRHYRKAWAAPVPVKVLDLSTKKGGLTPVKQGGSRQTLSLWVEDSLGREYVLRSIDKEPAVGLPEWLQQSYIAFIARDATSAAHPYAALTLPPMAEALGIYHTNPELVYIPHSAELGEYQETFAGMVAMLERRPDSDQSDAPWFGNAGNVKSSRTMISDRLRDNNTEVDARFFLRSRLFDMLLGDWSRHEDNWRWALYPLQEKGILYKAVPRDRDNVFYKLNDALIPTLFMATKLKQHFRTFRKEIRNVEALNRSGRNLDDLLLPSLPLEAWLQEADSIKATLTDEVLERAFLELPDTIHHLTAGPILERLKSRRDNLPEVARNYYKALSEEVNVVGTDKQEEFTLEYLDKNRLQVTSYKIRKDGTREKQLFQRTFHRKETKVLNVYGLDGNDRFEIIGDVVGAIKVHLYGGAGEDIYSAQQLSGAKGRVRIHDSTYRNTLNVGKYVKVKVDDNPPAQTLDANGLLLKFYLD